ncbi:hypothetical protein TWF506_008519 [Arthrobotrys conoides]|uniref:Uncharacterized protein n=1 Tax=Arthrobotrys conoides TaxID=74498 RepID=A0AAN8NPP9_9PEZI
MENNRLSLDELKEFNLSGVPIIPDSTSPHRHRHRGVQKYNDELDENLEQKLAEIDLNANDSVQLQRDIISNRQPTGITILSRSSEKHRNNGNPATIPNAYGKSNNPKNQGSKNAHTPRYQSSENTNFNNLSKTQQRKLRDRDRYLARVQQRIDANGKSDLKNTGLNEETRKSETFTPSNPKNSDHHSGTRGPQPVPKFTIIQRPSRPARAPSPVPPLVPSSVDAWLHEQSTSGPWDPLRLTTELSPKSSRDRRREHFQQIQWETDRDLAELDEYFETLETSIKED